MIVAGGTYVEECVAPPSTVLLGSGGRAAMALEGLEPIEFHTFYPKPDEIRANFGRAATVYHSEIGITFRYLHPLARPQVNFTRCRASPPVRVTGNKVLRFGCVEGEFLVEADNAVYDPQGTGSSFRANGSNARRLAVVLNEDEVRLFRETNDLTAAAADVMMAEGAEVVIIKRGPAGAIVLRRETSTVDIVPAFRTNVVFKIGSGDIFSTMFAHYWCTCGLDATRAAELASRQAADYVQTRILPRPLEPPRLEEITGAPTKLRILLSADIDTTPGRWLAEEARAALLRLGVRDVRVPAVFQDPVPEEMFADCDAVLVLPRTGSGVAVTTAASARDAGKPCVAFAETNETSTALSNVGAIVVGDFSASVYSVIWSAS